MDNQQKILDLTRKLGYFKRYQIEQYPKLNLD